MQSIKVIIAGGRYFDDFTKLKTVCDFILKNYNGIEVVSGGAKGADALGEVYANEKEYPVIKFAANWKENGKAAGPIRNKQMAEYADALIAFWDGKSKGTKNMIDLAGEYKLKIRVIYYNEKN